MAYQNDITDTLAAVRELAASGDISKGLEPDVVKSFYSTLGLIPYNLEPGAKLLSPVITPIRNILPRTKGRGRSVEFKAVTSYNNAGTTGWVNEGVSGPDIMTNTVDCVFPYKIAGMTNYLTFEGFYTAKGQVDAKALMMANLLRALMIDEEDRLLFGNPYSPLFGASTSNNNPFPITAGGVAIGGTLGVTPTMLAAQVATSTTGGLVPTGTVFNYRLSYLVGPDNGLNAGKTWESAISAADYVAPVTTTATSQIVVTPVTKPQAVAYVLYYKASGDTNYTRLVGNGRFVINTYTAGQGTVAPASLPTDNTAGNFGDVVTPNRAYAGIAQQILAPGNGATIIDKHLYPNPTGNPYALNANPQAFNDLDNLFNLLWVNAKADPDMLLMNSQESMTITNSLANTPFFIQPQGQQNETLGGYRVSRFINKVTGTFVDLRVHPTLPQGTIFALGFQMPAWFPGSDISNVWEFNYLYDYLSLEYAVTSPRLPIEVRNMGCPVCYFPLLQGAITQIAAF